MGLFILLSKAYAGSRWAIVRADLPTIKRNTYPSWDKIKPTNFIKKHDKEIHTVTFTNGSQIIFFPESYDTDKELNRWRGLEVNGFGFEEINECQRASLSKAFERAGSYIIKGLKKQPPPIIVATANPCYGWVRDEVYTPWKEGKLHKGWLYIQSRIYDNTPLLKEQPAYLESLKTNLTKYEYEVFVEGNWDIQLKTGNEFLRNFELSKHLKPTRYDPDLTIHVSIDNNVFPYIAITFWQIAKNNEGYVLRLIDEMPLTDPDNSARRAGARISKYLKEKNYNQKVFFYGDCSTQNRNSIDEEKRSFADIVINEIKANGFTLQNRMLSHNPTVSNVADFVNACLGEQVPNIRIEIGEHCKMSISDYIEVKQDADGGMLKTKQKDPKTGITYEPHGHLLDNFKDIMVQAFNDEFKRFTDKKKKITSGGIISVKRTPKYTF